MCPTHFTVLPHTHMHTVHTLCTPQHYLTLACTHCTHTVYTLTSYVYICTYTQEYLSDADIVPAEDPYRFKDVFKAITRGAGAEPFISCKDGKINEVFLILYCGQGREEGDVYGV